MDIFPVQKARDPAGARQNAQNHFKVAEARTTLVKKMMDEERKAIDAKTAKLRAQRLAKEEEDRIKLVSDPAPAPARGRRQPRKGSA